MKKGGGDRFLWIYFQEKCNIKKKRVIGPSVEVVLEPAVQGSPGEGVDGQGAGLGVDGLDGHFQLEASGLPGLHRQRVALGPGVARHPLDQGNGLLEDLLLGDGRSCLIIQRPVVEEGEGGTGGEALGLEEPERDRLEVEPEDL